MLRNLELDELRAIRASLPKFRNDQKRYLHGVACCFLFAGEFEVLLMVFVVLWCTYFFLADS